MTKELLMTAFLAISLVGGLGVFITGLVTYISSSKNMGSRVDQYIRNENAALIDSENQRSNKSASIAAIRDWLNYALRSISSDQLKRKISSAYWPITDIEYILILATSVLLSVLIGWLISSTILGGFGLGIISYFIPGLLLNHSIQKRQVRFQDQLVDVLVLIRGAVQSGYGLLQSLDVVVSELASPSSEEFGRVVREVQLGLSLNDALLNLANRMESDDLNLVVTAIVINTQVGGSLSTMLTAVTDTIRARYKLSGEIRALTSYARYASYMLSFLPFVTGVIMYLLSPDYFGQSIDNSITQIILALSLGLIIIGNIWLRRIAKIEV